MQPVADSTRTRSSSLSGSDSDSVSIVELDLDKLTSNDPPKRIISEKWFLNHATIWACAGSVPSTIVTQYARVAIANTPPDRVDPTCETGNIGQDSAYTIIPLVVLCFTGLLIVIGVGLRLWNRYQYGPEPDDELPFEAIADIRSRQDARSEAFLRNNPSSFQRTPVKSIDHNTKRADQNDDSPRWKVIGDLGNYDEASGLVPRAPSQTTLQKVLSSSWKAMVDGVVFGPSLVLIITKPIVEQENGGPCNMPKYEPMLRFAAMLLLGVNLLSTMASVVGYVYYKKSTGQDTGQSRITIDSGRRRTNSGASDRDNSDVVVFRKDSSVIPIKTQTPDVDGDGADSRES